MIGAGFFGVKDTTRTLMTPFVKTLEGAVATAGKVCETQVDAQDDIDPNSDADRAAVADAGDDDVDDDKVAPQLTQTVG